LISIFRITIPVELSSLISKPVATAAAAASPVRKSNSCKAASSLSRSLSVSSVGL